MTVLYLDWLDRDSREAVAIVEENGNRFEIFCYPCDLTEGQTFNCLLRSLDDYDIFRVPPQETYIRLIPDTQHNQIVARIEDKANKIVSVREIRIRMGGYLPGDVSNGEYLSFWTDRLDLSEKDDREN